MHHLPGQEESGYRLGLEPFLAQLLAYPKEIVLPQEGTVTEMGAVCAWIVLKGGTVPLHSPVSGTITRVNRMLREEPQVIVSDPLAAGWLFDVECRETNLQNTMDKRQAVFHYTKEKERFTTLLCNSLRRTALDVGTTLADGGSFVANLGEVIGHKKLFSIILEIVNA
jgi:glycine cleavage system H protein